MLKWTDPNANHPNPAAIPGLQFRDDSGRWVVAVVHARDPRQGWAVWEMKGGRVFRRAERAHLETSADAQNLAEVLERGLLRHVLRVADFGLSLATAVTVAWARRWSGTMGERRQAGVGRAGADEAPLPTRPWAEADNTAEDAPDDTQEADDGVGASKMDDERQVDPALVWSVLRWPESIVNNGTEAFEFMAWYSRQPYDVVVMEQPLRAAIQAHLVKALIPAGFAFAALQSTPGESRDTFADRVRASQGGKPITVVRPS